MKTYQVFMYDLALAPVSQTTNHRPSRIADFDDEQSATVFAKAERKKWDRVSVHKQGTDSPVITFRGNDMYVGTKRTRLTAEE